MMRGDDMADKMNIELDTVLANELKDARTHKQLSQDEIANLVGISRQKYQRIESRMMNSVDDNLLRKSAEVLELDYFTLVNNRNVFRLTVNITKEKRNDLVHLKDDKGFKEYI